MTSACVGSVEETEFGNRIRDINGRRTGNIKKKCRFLISGDSPMPRRQRATQQRSLVAMAGWGRRKFHPDEALLSLKKGAWLLVLLSSTRWSMVW